MGKNRINIKLISSCEVCCSNQSQVLMYCSIPCLVLSGIRPESGPGIRFALMMWWRSRKVMSFGYHHLGANRMVNTTI